MLLVIIKIANIYGGSTIINIKNSYTSIKYIWLSLGPSQERW